MREAVARVRERWRGQVWSVHQGTWGEREVRLADGSRVLELLHDADDPDSARLSVATVDLCLMAGAPRLLDIAWRLWRALERNQVRGGTAAGERALAELHDDLAGLFEDLEGALDEFGR